MSGEVHQPGVRRSHADEAKERPPLGIARPGSCSDRAIPFSIVQTVTRDEGKSSA